MTRRLLVLDAYDDAGREALRGAGATLAGELWRRLLLSLDASARVEVVNLGTGASALPDLSGFSGIAWTGSNMTIHRETAEVRRHVEIARTALAAGIPSFGSCWGLQLAVVAGGGACAANPRGREFGIARGLRLTDAGRAHPIFAGRAEPFCAFTSHEDHGVALAPGMTLLAGNEFSQVQAVVVEAGRGSFFAVQYHPEYGPGDVAALARLRGPQLLAQGDFPDRAALDAWITDMEALEREPQRADLRERLRAGDDVLDRAVVTREVRRWLDLHVEPRSGS